jgi:hypothetical protein
LFQHIDVVECFTAFKSITFNAVGVDGVSVRFFKLLLPLICCHVLHVFNHGITSSVFPSMWKVANIWPVAKVGTHLSNFHPISIVSVLSKAFERILHSQVLEHVNALINHGLFVHKLDSHYDFHTSAMGIRVG